MDFVQKIVDFIYFLIDTIKSLVSNVRTKNDEKEKEE